MVLVGAVVAGTTAGLAHGSAPPDSSVPPGAKPPATTATSTVPATSTTSAGKAGPSSTTAATTTTAPPAAATRTPIDVGVPLDDAWAAELLAPAFGRGYVIVGNSQAAGQVAVPHLWDSPDGLTWADAPAPTPPAGAVWRLAGGAWIGDQLTVWGDAAIEARPHAALWWSGDGRNFADAPELPFGDGWSTLTQVVAGPTGPIAVGYDFAADEPVVAIRDAAGSWGSSTMPDRALFQPFGITVRDSTVVVTGTDNSGQVGQAGALISTDGGSTFTVADTSALTGGFFNGLGEVVATGSGFAAAACMTSPDGTVTGLARSADGTVWTRQDLVPVDVSAPLPSLYNSSCTSLATDGTLVFFGLDDLGSWSLEVRPDGVFDAVEFERPEGRLGGYALVLPTPAGLIGIVDEVGGMYATNRSTGAIGSGLPPGHSLASDVGVRALSDGTQAVRVRTYPQITELGNGAWRSGPVQQWFDGAGGPLSMPENTDDVTATQFGDLALVSRDDPDDNGLSGPIGGSSILLREADGSWSDPGLVARGPGGEVLTEIVATPTGVLAIGYASIRAVNGPTSTQPLAFWSTDGRTWTAETPPVGGSGDAWFQTAEQVGERTVMLGQRSRGGAYVPFVTVRDAAGVWTDVAVVGMPADTAIETTAVVGDRLLVAASGRSGVELYVSDDLVNFTAVDVPAVLDDVSFGGMEAIGDLFVVPGSAFGTTDGDGAVWVSPDGVTWRRPAIGGIDGPGTQVLTSIAVEASGEIVAGGIDNGLPVLWRLPAGALD